MKNIFLNKIFIIIIMCIAIILSFMTSCFASTQIPVSNGNDITFNVILPDTINGVDSSNLNYCILGTSNRVSVYFSDGDIWFRKSRYLGYNGSSGNSKALFIQSGVTNNATYDFTSVAPSTFPNGVDIEGSIIYYSNCDIYSDSSLTEVVFQGAPQTVEQVTIPAIQEATQIPQAMGETLKVVLPIGLVVFGIGLVIYLIRSLIYRSM